MTLKSTLLNVLLIPLWLSLFIGATCTYCSFKFDSMADVKEAKFRSVEQQLSSIDCKDTLKRDCAKTRSSLLPALG